MFTLPCSTDGCEGLAADGRQTCDICHDRNTYPEGWSRSRDDAWLGYRQCHEIRWLPIEGPGCNGHPVTPRPDVCGECAKLPPQPREDVANNSRGSASPIPITV